MCTPTVTTARPDEALQLAADLRRRAAGAEAEAEDATRIAVLMAQRAGINVRDAAALLGVSYQRVQQIATEAARESAPKLGMARTFCPDRTGKVRPTFMRASGAWLGRSTQRGVPAVRLLRGAPEGSQVLFVAGNWPHVDPVQRLSPGRLTIPGSGRSTS